MTIAPPAPPTIDPADLDTLRRFRPPMADTETRLIIVSPMLANVLESLCEGKNNRAIGIDWGIREDTVKTHMKRLLHALQAQDRTHAVTLVYSGAVDVRVKPGGRRWTPPAPGREADFFLTAGDEL